MRFKAAIVLGMAAALSACGRKETPQETLEPPGPSAQVAATDELARFDAPVNAVAFWNHPSIPFNGLVIAGGESGLTAFNIEDGEEVARIDGVSVRGVDVAYIGRGVAAQGYAVAAVDDGTADDGGFRVYAIDNETRALTLLSSLFISGKSDGRGFCLTTESGRIMAHQMLPNGASTRPLQFVDRMITSGEAKSHAFPSGFVACAGDELDGAVFALTSKGDIYRIDPKRGLGDKPFARSGIASAAGIGLALNGLVEGGPTEQCCGQIAVLDGATGVIHLFDRDDGRALGSVTMKASFDVEGVAAATAMGLGYGNFGAVYRDGVLALATDGEAPAVRMTPLNGAVDALSIPIGPAANPRDLTPQDEEPALDFSVEPPSP